MGHRNLFPNEIHWKITTGCTEIGPGCDSCPSMPGNGFKNLEQKESGVHMHPDRLLEPSRNLYQKLFHVAMGSDLFHDSVTDEFIMNAFKVMNDNQLHAFSLITKRSDRLRYLASILKWTDNIHIGVTVSSASCKHRIDSLRVVKSNNKFVSAVPLLGHLGHLDLSQIQSFGVCEESWGPKRKIEQYWLDEIKKQCEEQDVNFDFSAAIISEES